MDVPGYEGDRVLIEAFERGPTSEAVLHTEHHLASALRVMKTSFRLMKVAIDAGFAPSLESSEELGTKIAARTTRHR